MKPGLQNKEAVMTETEILTLFKDPAVQFFYTGTEKAKYTRRSNYVIEKSDRTGKRICAFIEHSPYRKDPKIATKKLDLLWDLCMLSGNFEKSKYYNEYRKEYEKTQPALKWLKKIPDYQIISISDQPHEVGSYERNQALKGRR